MAITNHERIGKALEWLRDGLRPFVERELKAKYGDRWSTEVKAALSDRRLGNRKSDTLQDVSVLLVVMDKTWGMVFSAILGRAERGLVLELIEVRNRWAHQGTFSGDQAYRALDSVQQLLAAVSAPQADEVDRVKTELLRTRFAEAARGEKRKTAALPIESQTSGALKPWREVVTPHRDVASGKYQQAEFAADLWQVHLGEGSDEYRKPVEFFRRTYLTASLRQLLVGAVQRLGGSGGDPVVQLQTNFGGGKTHSMLALYHLFSGQAPKDLLGIEEVMREAEVSKLSAVNRVVLVGNKISPGNPVTKEDGTVVRTLWGELAWQLGHAAGGIREAKKAYKRIQADDERGTSPGDAVRTLMNDYGPSLILIDEWVAYARQLHDASDLPGGTFDTQFSFAQALTEAAKLAKQCLLVISLPASDTGSAPDAQADEMEVGGRRGHEALVRLRNVIGRVESSWRPASAEEGFEIVRRRLFEPLVEPEQFVQRDTVARAFYDFYRSQPDEFPPACRSSDYEERIKAAYPIHPEIFDRLYTDWSTLVKFQRTRGVLRLMAAVIHSLWEAGDKNPLILPAFIPINARRVQFELTRYLPDVWVPIIEKDVDGPNALPLQIDQQTPNLGKYSATRRVARTIYLGSAPTVGAAHHGLEDRQVKLGSVIPGESPQVFGDALRRLSSAATYLYQDGPRYWYATQPTVTKLAEDKAELYKRDQDKVVEELGRRLKADLRQLGDFRGVHELPTSGQDVADTMEARLVVLGPDHAHLKDGKSPAERFARTVLESRGNAPRINRNALVFLAPDQTRLDELQDALRRYLAWVYVIEEKDTLNLTPQQVKQAKGQLESADKAVTARLPEAYQWALVQVQDSPQAQVRWEAFRLTGHDSLAARVSKKLRAEELLFTSLAGTRLRMELDKVPLWRGDHVLIAQLIEDFAKYTYLPRLQGPETLLGAIRDGTGLLLWEQDSFGYADSYDESAGRYRGLRGGQLVEVSLGHSGGLLVRPEAAAAQLAREVAEQDAGRQKSIGEAQEPVGPAITGDAGRPKGPAPRPEPKRYHATVRLDSTRVARDAGRIAEEVLAHLQGLVGAEVEVVLQIAAVVPGGVPENVVRIVLENGATLRFQQQEFELE